MPEEKTTKIKKKKWFPIVAPEVFRNEPIGEIPVNDPKSLLNRTISVNLMSLARDINKQNISIKFIVTDIKGTGAVADFYGYYLNPSSIRRLVRKGKEKIGLSILCKTADNKKIRIMPLIIPLTKVKGSVATAFRKNAEEYLTSYAAKTTLDNMIKELIMNKLQRNLKDILKKVYPVRILEIAKLHIEREKKPVEKKEEIKEDKPKEEPKK